MTTDEVIKEEIEAILADIIVAYEQYGKKVSGNFIEGLEAVYEPNKATIKGFVYLAGRKKGKRPPVAALEAWVRRKGIFEIKSKSQARSIAYAIAKKIGEKGTNPNYHQKIYEQVITPERIDSIIDRVSKLNVNRIITMINAELEVLAKNV